MRFAPILPDPRKPLPYIRAAALYEVETVRVAPYSEVHRELAQDATTVPINKPLDGDLDAVEPGAGAVGDRQMEE